MARGINALLYVGVIVGGCTGPAPELGCVGVGDNSKLREFSEQLCAASAGDLRKVSTSVGLDVLEVKLYLSDRGNAAYDATQSFQSVRSATHKGMRVILLSRQDTPLVSCEWLESKGDSWSGVVCS
jgi:hypothetical protein